MNVNVKTPTRTYPAIPYRKMGEIDYDSLDFDPHESVEKPDAMLQHREQRAMLDLLDAYFADDGDSPDVFVDYDSNICWDPTNLRRHVSPDVYIAFGVDAKAIRERLIYLPWEVGKPPDFAMEIASPSTAKEDVKDKPRIYEWKIKAQELWMHDPSGGRYYKFPLKGFKMVDGKYQEIELTTGAGRRPKGVQRGLGREHRVGRRRPAPLRPRERHVSRKRQGYAAGASRGESASGRGGDAAGRLRRAARHDGAAAGVGDQDARRRPISP